MRLRLLRPRWLGIHLAALLIALGCALGSSWQFDAARQPERDAVPDPGEIRDTVDISAVSEPGEYLPIDETNQGVTATGTYDSEHQLLVPGLSGDGESGFYVVAPLVTGSETAVAVNRGWVDTEAAESGEPLPAVPQGEVTVTGWLTPPQTEPLEARSAALPDNHVERIAPAILVNQWPYQLYEGYITASEATEPGLSPAPPTETPEKYEWNWRNLSYSAQWALFAAAAVGFWIMLIRRELAGPRELERPEGAEPAPVG